MSSRLIRCAFATALTALVASFSSQAASAATPLSVEVGEQFSTQRPLSSNEPYFGLNYDIGPKTIIPVRASLQADVAGGGGRAGQTGFGIAARTTTPLYVGAGASLYSIGSGTYLGTNFFLGSTLFTVPGAETTIALQGTYRHIPARSSSVGVGLRVQL